MILLLDTFTGQCHGDRKYMWPQKTSSRMNELEMSHKKLG